MRISYEKLKEFDYFYINSKYRKYEIILVKDRIFFNKKIKLKYEYTCREVPDAMLGSYTVTTPCSAFLTDVNELSTYFSNKGKENT